MTDVLWFGVVGAIINAHFGPMWAMIFCAVFSALLVGWYQRATR